MKRNPSAFNVSTLGIQNSRTEQLQPMDKIDLVHDWRIKGVWGIRKKLCIPPANNYTIRRLEDRILSGRRTSTQKGEFGWSVTSGPELFPFSRTFCPAIVPVFGFEKGSTWLNSSLICMSTYLPCCGIIKLGEPSVVLWSRTDVTGQRVSVVYEGILTKNDSWERYG
ncbi:hypothetical protein K435DRAFT_803998 [Dendrothele bispora CBS 962.96]|uniref:Uncharacterized protein n=1 Tax=Dendrothele bispora (strain CBS 962.96) TaxID=1314807 RepID=A0A4S8LGY2_DENBC|nr:hypothetical protein K435DRAFT_803998 [Dendrothele bispora CBS 962.96]